MMTETIWAIGTIIVGFFAGVCLVHFGNLFWRWPRFQYYVFEIPFCSKWWFLAPVAISATTAFHGHWPGAAVSLLFWLLVFIAIFLAEKMLSEEEEEKDQ